MYIIIKLQCLKHVYLLNTAVRIVWLIPNVAEQPASLSLVYHIEINPLINPVALFLLSCLLFAVFAQLFAFQRQTLLYHAAVDVCAHLFRYSHGMRHVLLHLFVSLMRDQSQPF